MLKVWLYALVLGVSLSGAASAQEQTQAAEGETTIKIEDAAGKKNKVEGDIDQEVTNARMRAESGSKSKFSMSSQIAYTGGAISRPFGQERPTLNATDPSVQSATSADFSLSGRYRWTKKDSLLAGIAFGLMTPFQGDMNARDNQFNLFNPYVGYNRVGKVGPFQTTFSASASAGTSQESRKIEHLNTTSVSYNALYAFANRLTVGSSVALGYRFYGSEPGVQTEGRTARPGFYGGDRRTQYTLGIFPYAEYAFNDRFSARTVFGYFNWQHLYGDDKSARLLQTYVYQSVGIGMALTRDIYLYPNVQFLPGNIDSEITNVALSATINMF